MELSRVPPRSIFDYDVSVSADKRRRVRRRGMSGAFETAERICEHAGCTDPGAYRAPLSPDRLDEFRWFCLDHVRDYNRSWNFYEDWSDEDVEAQIRNDRVWDRPTWSFREQSKSPMGTQSHAEGNAWRRFGFRDPMEVLGDNATINPAKAERDKETSAVRRLRRLPENERRALEILDAGPEQTRTEIRKEFRALVKSLHPDMNAGSREDEARLTEVLWAWDQVKSSRNFKV
jgi:hypothetical protein